MNIFNIENTMQFETISSETKTIIENKIKAFEIKLLTYIDIYNIKFTKMYETETNTDTDNNETQYENLENNIKCNITFNYDKDDNDNPIINYTTIKLERIGNLEKIYNNFTNIKKSLNKKLIYRIHKLNILLIIEICKYIMENKGYTLNFINYRYELYNVIGVYNTYVIQQTNKNIYNSNYYLNFIGSCIMFIFIKDKLFIHYY